MRDARRICGVVRVTLFFSSFESSVVLSFSLTMQRYKECKDSRCGYLQSGTSLGFSLSVSLSRSLSLSQVSAHSYRTVSKEATGTIGRDLYPRNEPNSTILVAL